MTERHPSFTYEQTRTSEGTALEDGTVLDLHASKLSPLQEVHEQAGSRVGEPLATIEHRPVYGHEGAINSTLGVRAMRRAELDGSDSLYGAAA